MAPPPVRILALTGSLRRLSANTALLRACAASPHATVVLGDVSLPLYNSDTEAAEFSAPAASSPVRALRDLARGCDALLLAAPEYNHSFSPVLGNALAWLSRDGADGAAPQRLAVQQQEHTVQRQLLTRRREGGNRIG